MYRNRKVSLGTVSHGTLRAEDLIPTFLSELAWFKPRAAAKLEKEYADVIEALDTDDADQDGEMWLIDALHDALNEVASSRPFFYFGSHPGDASDFGYWVEFEEVVSSGEVLNWTDCSRNPSSADLDGYAYYCRVNDHGNVTLYARNHKEMWGIV